MRGGGAPSEWRAVLWRDAVVRHHLADHLHFQELPAQPVKLAGIGGVFLIDIPGIKTQPAGQCPTFMSEPGGASYTVLPERSFECYNRTVPNSDKHETF